MLNFQISDNAHLALIEERHAGEFHALVQKNHDRLQVWCPWLDQVETIDKTQAFIRGKLARFADGNGFTAGFYDDGNLAGSIALEYVDRPNLTTEIGYWLDADAEGSGLVTTACRRLIVYAFDELDLNRVQIRCAADNARSRAIPEKLGFRQEGVIRQCERLHDRFVDLVLYGMLRHEWISEN